MTNEIRYCEDIAMYAIDRPVTSCKHATRYCKANCYNNKLYALYPAMKGKDCRNEEYWNNLDGLRLNNDLNKKHKQIKRFRLMTRGEAFSSIEDVYKVADLIKRNPGTLFWIPTRAWRNSYLKANIESIIFPLKNARVQASVDPSNTKDEIASLVADNWSIMGFGWNTREDMANQLGIQGATCAKTHDHVKGACATCKGKCFSRNQTVVFLDKH